VKKHSSKLVVQQLVEALNAVGVKQIVISPGSRNAPFMIELSNDKRFECLSIIDERAAAFFALGLCQKNTAPVAIICTSGTALLNYAPAIAEAYYQRLSVIVISADRPAFWINKGEGQSIVQTNVFESFTETSFQLVEDELEHASIENFNRLNQFVKSVKNKIGPVHINVPFNEPLYDVVNEGSNYNYSTIESSSKEEFSIDHSKFLGKKRVLILLGQHQENTVALKRVLTNLSDHNEILVLGELHSNLCSENVIYSIDTLIMALGETAQQLIQPDLLITIGTNIVSRKIKAILRKAKPMHIQLGVNEKVMDTFNCLTEFIPVSPELFLEKVVTDFDRNSEYGLTIRRMFATANSLGKKYLKQCEFSDLKAMEILSSRIPKNSVVHLGNSSVIRYFHLVNAPENARYQSNRGVAGIDGCTSTAVGNAFGSDNLTVLISGDLAFLYDANAFWNNYVSPKLKVVVINNQGGGIFRIIEGAKDSDFLETLQETAHTQSVQGLVNRFGLTYFQASNESELSEILDVFFENPNCAVLEIHTPRLTNANVLNDFFKAVILNHE
jgi:2-succinyl-5-enolpyruvyl-6-hydroxy-3-cyclohexene-1-carboxylate synthase